MIRPTSIPRPLPLARPLVLVGLCAVGLCALPACTASREELSVGHRDPSVKIPGMKKAVRTHDTMSIQQLVADLDSSDPAVRFYAINALRRLTGQDFDYRYYDDETERTPALARWNEWLQSGAYARGDVQGGAQGDARGDAQGDAQGDAPSESSRGAPSTARPPGHPAHSPGSNASRSNASGQAEAR